MNRRFVCLPSVVLLLAALPLEAADVDYQTQIKPILAEHCCRCHGPEEQNSELRLDTAALALRGGLGGAAVVPHKSRESLLLKAISGTGDVTRMPPEGDGEPLSAKQIELIKTWIDQGAKAPADEVARPATAKKPANTHWAFQPVQRVKPPAVKDESWPKNEIDRFILARLEQEGISPSAEADRATLIRRLSFDLLGLPPSSEEVEQFANDTSPDAYERLVDRLLASPHFGERWGRHWLDLARYADSNGFTIDGPRQIWKYRDWVIGAMNRDLPFDQFTIQQIAGDMLEKPSIDQLVATGFHRNTLINQEGGTDKEQFRVESVVDRVNTTGAVFLGLTLGCAQCHTHKYDPISHKEYYQFYAFLNNADEPSLPVPTPEQIKQRKKLQADLAKAEAALKQFDGQADQRLDALQKRLSAMPLDVTWQPLDPEADPVSDGGATLEELDDKSLLAGGKIPTSDRYTVTLALPLQGAAAIRLEALTHDSLPKKGPGLAGNGNFVLTDIAVHRRTLAEPDTLHPVKLVAATADHSQPKFAVEDAIDGDPEKSGWAINNAKGSMNVDRTAVFVFDKPLGAADIRLTVTLTHAHPSHYNLGRFRISATSAPPEVLMLADDIREILATPADKRTKEQNEALAVELGRNEPQRIPLQAKVSEVRKRLEAHDKSVATTMIMRERAQPRETFVQIRGDFLRPGAKVEPDVLAVLPPLPEEIEKPTRLDLARWLVDPQNPLTPRVTVNRFWQKYFGTGLVETENDFGTQGTPPTHPELLDWLAREFVDRGWSMKAMHRLIVTSATYRQSSRTRSDLESVDPRNKLLARQSRLRLEAETIRDAALAASGLLSRKIGGPSVFPPQPEGIYRFTQTDKKWQPSQGEDRYRRGMYTYFWRSSPHPFLMTFDAPGANVTCTRRVHSNTPLQALTLANDQGFVELAQGLAERLLGYDADNDSSRLQYAFECCLAREATKSELATLAGYLENQRQSFTADPSAAKSVAPTKRPAEIGDAEAAAWTSVARVLLNLDEFITRE
jgi:mono/diheme cytochrome c family protein